MYKYKGFNNSVLVLISALTIIFFLDFSLNYQLREIFGLYPGEYHRFWTVLTVNLMHGGLLHLFVNCFVLYILSNIYVSIPGRGVTYWVVLCTTGIMSGIATMIFASPGAPHVGISGAIFGLLGYAYLAFVQLPGSKAKAMKKDLGFVLLFNLLLTFAIPFISITGHIGGLLSGIVLYFLMSYVHRTWYITHK